MGEGGELGRMLREAREKLRFTQFTLAYAAGVSRRSVARWEHGDARPRADEAARLVKALLQVDPPAARAVARVLGVRVADPPPPPAPPPPLSPVEFDHTLYAVADALDVPAKRFRAEMARLLDTWAARGVTVADARARLSRK